MSNIATVTPYDSREAGNSAAATAVAQVGVGLAAACIAGAAAGAVAVVKWLAEETPEDRKAVQKAAEERRRERLAAISKPRVEVGSRRPEQLSIASVGLHLHNPESLVRTAEKLGYRLERHVSLDQRTAQQPWILLRGNEGERVAIERTSKGKLVVHTGAGRDRLEELVRRHTVDQALEHLSKKGMSVRAATLPNGEVQIVAKEQGQGLAHDTAEVKTQIGRDGTVWVDVDGVRGTRCEAIVEGLAKAVGGQVSQTSRKSDWYQLPGEIRKIRQEI